MPIEPERPVLVTGGRGFLGSFVCEELRRRGATGVVPLASADADLTDPRATEQLFARARPAGVLHLAAAIGGVGANVARPGWFAYANTMMGANVLEAARRTGVAKLTVIGTACVYSENAPVPTPETAMLDGQPARDTAPYGMAKRNLWSMGAAYRTQYGMSVAFLIPTNVYGPRDHFEEERSGVVAALVRRFVEAREAAAPQVLIWGDGTATREFIYAGDAARAIVDAHERYDGAEPLNIGTGREVTIRELAQAIRHAVGYRGELLWDPSKPRGAARRCLDVRRAREVLGFNAEVGLSEGLKATAAWYEAARRAAQTRPG